MEDKYEQYKNTNTCRSLINKRIEQGQEQILAEHLDELKRNKFVIVENPTSAPVKKEKLSPSHKAKRKESKNNFVKKAKCQVESKVLEKLARIVLLGLLNRLEIY